MFRLRLTALGTAAPYLAAICHNPPHDAPFKFLIELSL
jgi:hypothetical protein